MGTTFFPGQNSTRQRHLHGAILGHLLKVITIRVQRQERHLLPACCAGAIPSALATHPHLEELDVKGNSLNRLPREWVRGWPGAASSSLVLVRFSVNDFTGRFPAALARAPDLKDLLMGTNALRWGRCAHAGSGLDGAIRDGVTISSSGLACASHALNLVLRYRSSCSMRCMQVNYAAVPLDCSRKAAGRKLDFEMHLQRALAGLQLYSECQSQCLLPCAARVQHIGECLLR